MKIPSVLLLLCVAGVNAGAADTPSGPAPRVAVRAPTYAYHTLQAGFTTVRDVGAVECVDELERVSWVMKGGVEYPPRPR